MKANKKQLPAGEKAELIKILKVRFEKNMTRHKGINWAEVEKRLTASESVLWTISEMEGTGGEPDVIGYDENSGEFVYCDCSPESPDGRRSVCYDREAWESRKEHRPENTAMDMAEEMGIDMLDEEGYRNLQKLGKFDTKTSSWLKTPADIRKLGGAIFGDYRYGQVFIYHNGASSYYAARGFRGVVRV